MATIPLNSIEDISIEMNKAIKTAEFVLPPGSLSYEQSFVSRSGVYTFWKQHFEEAGTHGAIFALNAYDGFTLRMASFAMEDIARREFMVRI